MTSTVKVWSEICCWCQCHRSAYRRFPSSAAPQVRKRQMEENNPYLGIDCNDTGTNDMREQNVFETFLSKRQQLFLATQVRRGIRKRDFYKV